VQPAFVPLPAENMLWQPSLSKPIVYEVAQEAFEITKPIYDMNEQNPLMVAAEPVATIRKSQRKQQWDL
jgi:hypothetical protein